MVRNSHPSQVTVRGNTYERIPIKTKVITCEDDIVVVSDQSTQSLRADGDWIVVSESVVAVTQGRAVPESEIRIGLLAKALWRFVRKVPYGTGLRRPSSMQCAINECGAIRIVCAAVVGGITRLFGRRGDFYRIAGKQAATIDAAQTSPLQPECVIMGPENPELVAGKIKSTTGCDCAIMDINDIGGSWAIGYTPGIDKTLIEDIMRDNPMGQKAEQTPICLVRRA